ncbi:unnamed protein product [Rotaria sp. Silwood1]|nr:unnamed protein product [Rotaria sp. Silwood1]CAF1669360.1 unnamed protein product [Rotaria sp. Silwood1]CAF3886196.1 unnamed protein product [Rotaria sp. Silwood1]
MTTCSNFVPGQWIPEQCCECFQGKEKHVGIQAPTATIDMPIVTDCIQLSKRASQPHEPTKQASSIGYRAPIISRDRSFSAAAGDNAKAFQSSHDNVTRKLSDVQLSKSQTDHIMANQSSKAGSTTYDDIEPKTRSTDESRFQEIQVPRSSILSSITHSSISPSDENTFKNEHEQQPTTSFYNLDSIQGSIPDHPLMFAVQALKYKKIATDLDERLIGLIDEMRLEYPTILDNILAEEYKEIKKKRAKIIIAVFGSTKSSKSSFVNFLLQVEVCPTGNQAATARLTKITYGSRLRLSLTSSTGIEKETTVFNDTRELLQKAKELIILKNDARKSKLCEDIVEIELPISELKNVELWDTPGFDENMIIDERTSRIAAKLIPLNDFKLQEVLYMHELKHKNIISYYGVKKKTEDQYYIIMPCLDCNLVTYLTENSKRFTSDAIDQMIIQIVEGLNYIHTQLELVHRDIKLQNILVNKPKTLFLIADLGGVHIEPLTHLGTAGYMAPELFSADNVPLITQKCDVYSLGIVIQQIIRLADIEQQDDTLIIGWTRISKRCVLNEPSKRPTCEKILQMRLKNND